MTDNLQSASDIDVEPVCSTQRVDSTDKKSSLICSENSPKPKHPFPSADKRSCQTSGAGSTSDSRISTSGSRRQQLILAGHLTDRSRDAEVNLRRETAQRRSSASTSADHSKRSSSAASRHGRSSPSSSQHHRPSSHRAPESSKDRSAYHSSGRELRSNRQESGSHTEPESSKDHSAYHSGSFSSAREHRSSRQKYEGESSVRSNTRSLERLRYYPEGDTDARCDTRSAFQRLRYQKDSVSCQDRKRREPSCKKYEEPVREQPSTSLGKVEERQSVDLARYKRRDTQLSKNLDRLFEVSRDSSKAKVNESEDVARYKRKDIQLTKDLDRLSVVGADSTKAKVRDSEKEGLAEYTDVLTRHVNQLFIRGDNVTLVSIVG